MCVTVDVWPLQQQRGTSRSRGALVELGPPRRQLPSLGRSPRLLLVAPPLPLAAQFVLMLAPLEDTGSPERLQALPERRQLEAALALLAPFS